MKGMILAAGLGTRLRPITDTIPKALVEVAGVPMLGRVIESMVEASVSEIVVNVHHFAGLIEKYLEENDFGVRVTVSREFPGPLETGGCIRKAAPLLRDDEPVLVHNVDMLSNLDLGAFCRFDGEPFARLLVCDCPSERCLLFDNYGRLTGWMNRTTGEVRTPYDNYDPSTMRAKSFCGIHTLSQEAIGYLERWPSDGAFSIIDFYLEYCSSKEIIAAEAPSSLRIADIGTVESLHRACDEFARGVYSEKVF